MSGPLVVASRFTVRSRAVLFGAAIRRGKPAGPAAPVHSRHAEIRSRLRNALVLMAITAAAVLIHGYHQGTDDAEIYIPAIKRAADNALYPFHSEFFSFHASLSLFPNLIGSIIDLTRLSPDAVIFLAHALCLLLLFFAARRLACACFRSEYARWSAVAVLACALTIPVAGTALVIADPYLTARSLSTPLTLFAIACFAERKRARGFFYLLATALIHPQMSVYCAAFLACFEIVRRRALVSRRVPAMAAAYSFLLPWALGPATGVYREILHSRAYFLVSSWHWWEWAGVVAPLLLLSGFSMLDLDFLAPPFQLLSRSLVPFGLIFTAAGLLLASSETFENVARVQPMRSFHLVYVVFFLLLGGLAGEYLLRARPLRWLAFFSVLATPMFIIQACAFPSSPHIEWPGRTYRSGWVSAFLWVRANTPKNAVFALNPNYMLLPGVDLHGFRAIAERSSVAENAKDSGAVSVFPQLAGEWSEQVTALYGWKRFKLADFKTLSNRFGVEWVIVNSKRSIAGLQCPYQNNEVKVCRIAPAPFSRLAAR